MKFRGNFIKSTLLSLAAVVALGGCNAGGVSSSGGVSSTVPSVTATTAATTAPSLDLPDPVTGTYNGNAVTMRYTAMTDLNIDIAYCQPFQNDYAIVLRKEKKGNGTMSFVDKNGCVLGDTVYSAAYPFDSDGKALVQNADGSWCYIDKTGKKVEDASKPESQETDLSMYYEKDGYFGLQDESGNSLTEAVYSHVRGFHNGYAFVCFKEGEPKNALIDRAGDVQVALPDDCSLAIVTNDRIICTYKDGSDIANTRYQLLDLSGTPLNERRFKAIGNFVDGLAPVMEDGKLGLMDEAGQIVIEPSLPLDDSYQVDLQWGENRIVVTRDGKLAIVEVAFS